MAENLSQQYSEAGPCTLEHALWHVDTHSSLPPAATLKIAEAAEVRRMVESDQLAPFLKEFLPAAFGARSAPRAPQPAHAALPAACSRAAAAPRPR